MPSESAHIGKVLHNVNFVRFLVQNPAFHDWMAVAAFYAALHVVETLFSRQKPPQHGQSHERRESILKRTRRYEKIYRHYRELQGIATIARYLEGIESTRVSRKRGVGTARTFAEYMTPQEVLGTVVQHHLISILKSAAGLASQSAAAQRFAEAASTLAALRMGT